MRASALSLVPESEPITSDDHGTPKSNLDDIPIDPALMDSVDRQSMYAEQNEMHQDSSTDHYQEPDEGQSAPLNHFVRDYSEGPQGDPFAPQPQPFFEPPLDQSQLFPPPKPMKRKKKQKRDAQCYHCFGEDVANRDGQPEIMLSCVDCGRNCHPSCLPLKHMSVDALRSRPWKCAACKSCEICGSKDNDQDLLLCDGCDRGWHGSCFDPPVETPEGDWFCSECSNNPNLNVEINGFHTTSNNDQTALEDSSGDPLRASSVASSSRSHSTHTTSKMATSRKRGRAPKPTPFPAAMTDDELDLDVGTNFTPLRRTRTKSMQSTKKSKGTVFDQSDDDLVTPSNRQPKRMRIRVQSPITNIPKVRLRVTQKGKGKAREREDDESKGLFDEVLEEDARDTSRTVILQSDKQRFERSRAVAEEKLVIRPLQFSEIPEDDSIAGPSSRPLRSATLNQIPTSVTSISPAPSTPGGPNTSKNDPPTLRIRSIRFGAYEIKTWYDAPFPEEYANIPDGRLWICEFCLKYMKSKFGAVRHRMKCKAKHPPGDEIYRDGSVSIFEVDGRKNKIYCQNLCLLSKMYLDHKSLFYDVEPFLFYVMTEVDDVGARFVGYFSKEKRSPKDYNVSCIMTLPVRQRQGWGNLLIDFSYLLSKKEQRTGSPEKPLSALGALGYKNYWTLSLMRYLETAPENPRLEDISIATSMTVEDIYNTLLQQNMISSRPATPPPVRPSPGQSIKYIKGRRGGSVARRNLQRTLTNTSERSQIDDEKNNNDNHHAPKGPFIAPKEYKITWSPQVVQNYLQNWEAKGYLKLRAEKLKWSPFLVVRSGAGEEVGVVKKTEAKGAVTTGVSAEGENSLAALIANMERGSGGVDTPLSLFDDDNVVDAKEMMVPDLSKSPAQSPSPQSPDFASSSQVFPNDRKSILFSGTSASDRESSPSTRRRKNRLVSSNASGTEDMDVSMDVPGPELATTQDMESDSGLEASLEQDQHVGFDLLVRATASQRRLRQNGRNVKDEDATHWAREETYTGLNETAEGESESGHSNLPGGISPFDRTSAEDEAEISASERRSLSRSSLPRSALIGRVTRQSSRTPFAASPSPCTSIDNKLKQSDTTLPIPLTNGRQVRHRLTTPNDSHAPADGLLGGEERNGRRSGSTRKRRRVDSSPETDAHSESPVAVSILSNTDSMEDESRGDANLEGPGSEEATAATSLLSLLHSKPVVFNGDGVDMGHGTHYKIKVEDTDMGSRHSIPSDVTVFGSDTQSARVNKGDEQIDVGMVDGQGEEDDDLDADGSVDDGEYDLDDANDGDS